MLREPLQRLLDKEDLAAETMAAAIGYIMDGEASAVSIAAFLTALRMKGETSDEILGAAQAMRQRMTPVNVQRRPLIDTCGTGGDGSGSFNISTAVAFVVAAGGVAVAKHGNRAVSSRSGSADVLAALGVNIAADPLVMQQCIEDIGIGFLFAPSLHPAMQHAAAIRRELKMRTIFNVLGPLTNPAGAPRQLMGVFARDLVQPIAEVLGNLGCEYAWVVHGEDGQDEISISAKTHVAEWDGRHVKTFSVEPADVGLAPSPMTDLVGGSPEENAVTMRRVLAGDLPGALQNIIVFNAGAALKIAGTCADLRDGVERAKQIIASGSALAVLDALVEHSKA
ncbi:MAG: anthranilate phosphoribosyltransferase [Myxococcota bacterium]